MNTPAIKIEVVSIVLEAALLCVIFTGCSPSKQNATLGGSQDTTSVTRAGGPPIKDTATLNAERKKNAATAPKDSTAKGNADPTGHVTKPASAKQ